MEDVRHSFWYIQRINWILASTTASKLRARNKLTIPSRGFSIMRNFTSPCSLGNRPMEIMPFINGPAMTRPHDCSDFDPPYWAKSSLCDGCHAKVHRTIAVLTEMLPLLLTCPRSKEQRWLVMS